MKILAANIKVSEREQNILEIHICNFKSVSNIQNSIAVDFYINTYLITTH